MPNRDGKGPRSGSKGRGRNRPEAGCRQRDRIVQKNSQISNDRNDETRIKLIESAPLRENTIQTAIDFLDVPPGSHGLDIGCGIGLHIPMLVKAVGKDGGVTGIDLSPELIAHAKKTMEKIGINSQATLLTGTVNSLQFDDETFDWIWSCDCVGYPSGNLLPDLQEIKRVLKPGGTIAILGWTSQQVLPGYPILETRLNTTCSSVLQYYRGSDPRHCFQRALGAFIDAGFRQPKAKTFICDVQSPLSDDIKTAMVSLFDMLWGDRQQETSQADWEDYQRLCHPKSSEFILNIPDYYGFFTYSMFIGQR